MSKKSNLNKSLNEMNTDVVTNRWLLELILTELAGDKKAKKVIKTTRKYAKKHLKKKSKEKK
jgi:hypothetical protein